MEPLKSIVMKGTVQTGKGKKEGWKPTLDLERTTMNPGILVEYNSKNTLGTG